MSPPSFHHGNDQGTQASERHNVLYGGRSHSARDDCPASGEQDVCASLGRSDLGHREVELEKPATLRREQQSPVTLAELIRWYIDTFETISKWQRSKQSHLEFLERHEIGKTNVVDLTAATLIGHVLLLRANGAGPATVINDLIWIGVVPRAARSVKDLPVSPEIVQPKADNVGCRS